jgi:hypothetical protein
MADLKIPERYRPGLKILAALTDKSFQDLSSAARRVPGPFVNFDELVSWLAPEVTSIPPTDLRKLVDSLSSLHRLLSRRVSSKTLARDVRQSAVANIPSFVDTDGLLFEERLSELVELKAFEVVAVKAKELQTQTEKRFCDARILSDLRPVFGEDVESGPSAMVLTYTLKIGFHNAESAAHKDIYIALDEDDIRDLKKILERAEEKAKSLKILMSKSRIKTVDLT